MPAERFWEKLVEKIENIDKEKVREYIDSLLRERGLLENIFNSLTEGILVLDSENNPVYMNKQLNKMLNIDTKNLFKSFSYYNSRLAYLILEQEGEVKDEEIEMSKPPHSLLKVSKLPLLSSEGQSLGAIIIIDDITQEKRLQEEKTQNERLAVLSQLSAGVAHEIGNPLNALQIHLELLKKEVRKLPKKSQEKLTGFVKVIREEIKRLDSIVSQFLEASRPSLIRLEERQIENIIKELISFLSPEFKKHKIEVKEDFSSFIPPVLLDYNQIRQAFLNILKNSIEAMPDGGKIYISTFLKGDRIGVSIKDEGMGIPEDKIYRMFEPYFTTKEKGSGLGLMITHRIIKAHGGEIKIKSRPGEGTEITVLLPLKREKVPLPVHFPSKAFKRFFTTHRKVRK
jgi:two-component system, sporulation sensor kinase E